MGSKIETSTVTLPSGHRVPFEHGGSQYNFTVRKDLEIFVDSDVNKQTGKKAFSCSSPLGGKIGMGDTEEAAIQNYVETNGGARIWYQRKNQEEINEMMHQTYDQLFETFTIDTTEK